MLLILLLLLALCIPTKVYSYRVVPPTQIEEKTLTHQQMVWVHALEWCESRGNPDAINAVDLDGTPSYGSWQFKPSTLLYFGHMYGVLPSDLGESNVMDFIMNRDVQFAVLEQMILDRENIRWDRQFPWCVEKLGYPPRA